MLKNIGTVLFLYISVVSVWGQTNEINRILQEIEQNNNEIKAYASWIESRKLALKTQNNLPDPQVGVYYLPWGEHQTGDYSEFQVTQSFEFPTVYSVRSKLIDKQYTQLELEYAEKRKSVLLPAKQYCLQLVYLQKKKEVEEKRVQQAQQVFNHISEMYNSEEVSLLDVNKAKISWIQEQFRVTELETKMQNVLLTLQQLNGGNEIMFSPSSYETEIEIDPVDSLWVEKQNRDPELRSLNQQEEVALQNYKLSKNKGLPNLTAGYNYQGVSGSNYSGIYGGLSIPLWSNRNKVKSAASAYQYSQSLNQVAAQSHYAEFQKQYNNYQVLKSKYTEYVSTLSDLNSESMLLEAYHLGQISYLEYFMELQFYRDAMDTMLKMEMEMHVLKASLLDYQL